MSSWFNIIRIGCFMKTFILSIVVACLFSTSAWAEHEVDHRYNIRGYVLDENQKGISNQEVQAFKEGNFLKAGKTDSAGYYSLHLHVHNEDNRTMIKLRTGGHEAEVRVNFDPRDLTTLRIHNANFIDGKLVESELSRYQIPPWIYPIGGLLALGVIAVMLEKRRKKKIRQKKYGSAEKAISGKHKSKKARRKKH